MRHAVDGNGQLTDEGAAWLRANFDEVADPFAARRWGRRARVKLSDLSNPQLKHLFVHSPDLVERTLRAQFEATWRGRVPTVTNFFQINRGLDTLAKQLEQAALASNRVYNRQTARQVLDGNAGALIDCTPRLAEFHQAALHVVQQGQVRLIGELQHATKMQRYRIEAQLERLRKQEDRLHAFRAGRVGRKRPDAVEVLLDNNEVNVWDFTLDESAVHRFKTEFYAVVTERVLGPGVSVTGMDYRSAFRQRDL